MATKLQPGMTVPDFELPDENGEMHKLSELQGENPMILLLGRGEHCPRERQHQKELIKLYEWCAVGFASMVTVLPNDQHETYKLKISTPAAWTYLCDENLEVQRTLGIDEYTDPHHDATVPHTLVLAPGLRDRQGLRRLLVLGPALRLPAVGRPRGPVPPDQARLRPHARRRPRSVGGERGGRSLIGPRAKQAELGQARLVQPGAPPARRAATAARGLPALDAEPFWPAQLTAAAALVLYLTLPHALIMGPKWLVPGVEGVLLLGLVITTPTRHHNQSSRCAP